MKKGKANLRGDEMVAKAKEMAEDTEAFYIVKINGEGKATINAGGKINDLCFMGKIFESFLIKLVDGDLK